MVKVKIGDEIIMNKKADEKYRYTSAGYRGIITDIFDDDKVEIDGVWIVDENDCDLYGEVIKDKPASKKTDDTVNHPSHYTAGKIECIDAIKSSMSKEAFAGYCKGNIIKYLWRYEFKGGVESLEKARWYLNKLIEVMGD